MRNETVRWTAKGVVVAGASVGVFKLWKKNRKAEAVALAVVIGGVGFALAAHNERVGR
jgi:hypothetical protein